MIPPKQVITAPQGSGVSETFTAQWCTDVAAVLNIDYGTEGSITVALEGSLDNQNWIPVVSSAFTTGSPQKLEKPATGFYLYYRLNISDATNGATITSACIGCGGA